MSWRPEVPADFAGEGNKIKWRAMRYVRGLGLDIGCGPWKVFPHSIGLDGQAYIVSDNRGPNLVMDCTSLKLFSDGMFDYVFSSHFLEHVQDPEAVLREWWKKLKVDGRLILYLPHKDFYPNMGQPGANPDHKQDFQPRDIVKIMKRVGGWTLLENEERGSEAYDYEYSFFQVYKKRADSHQVDVSHRPSRGKTAALVRSGNFGDAIWASSVAASLKRDGYHVTVYVEPHGETVLKHDPNIDELVVLDRHVVPLHEWGLFFDHEKKLYSRWINFIQTAEVELLKTEDQASFYWPAEVRRRQCDQNYVEFMHRVAETQYELAQRFYPTAEERAWAKAEREKLAGRVIVLANAGSTAPKWWPYAPVFAQLLAELGIHVVIVGDMKGLVYAEDPHIHVMGTGEWAIRQSLTFAHYADAIVGQETGLLNASALEPVAKVVLLSHSSATNLTRDWTNVRALAGAVPCYPCHQIHYTHKHCPQDEASKAAKCQAAIRVEDVMEALRDLGVVTADELAKLSAPVAEEVA
jgi:ADP-heptose:LPS heptosyltransferase/predicted SAM-dependent methyltransferase